MEAARQVRGQTAVRLRQRPTPRASAKMTRGDAASAGEYTNLKWSGAQATLAEAVRIRGTGKLKVNYKLRLRPTPDFRLVHACGANERSGSRDRRVTDLLFGVHLFASVRPLNACPPEGPEALQASVPCSREPRHGLSHAWNLLNSSRRSRGREAPFWCSQAGSVFPPLG